jgi:prefoldin subunit 5
MASANDKMILVNERLAETIEAQKQIIQDQAQAIKHQAQRLFGSVMTLREIDDELRSLRKRYVASEH